MHKSRIGVADPCFQIVIANKGFYGVHRRFGGRTIRAQIHIHGNISLKLKDTGGTHQLF